MGVTVLGVPEPELGVVLVLGLVVLALFPVVFGVLVFDWAGFFLPSSGVLIRSAIGSVPALPEPVEALLDGVLDLAAGVLPLLSAPIPEP